MATLFQKIKQALGFIPGATCYRIEQKTGEPVKVTYDSVQEEVATDDSLDLSAMTKAELLEYAKLIGASANRKMKKQEIIQEINKTLP